MKIDLSRPDCVVEGTLAAAMIRSPEDGISITSLRICEAFSLSASQCTLTSAGELAKQSTPTTRVIIDFIAFICRKY